MILIFAFFLGLGVGSFLNVVAYRLNTGESIVHRRSRCFTCGTALGWQELIPVASFLVQKGKCRHCGSKISFQYPLVELLTGIVFLLTFLKFNVSAEGGFASGEQLIFNGQIFKLFYFFVVFSILIAISVYDLRHKIIPNQLVYPFIALTFVFGNFDFGNWKLPPLASLAFGGELGISALADLFLQYFVAGFFAFLFFAGLWFISRGRWMGFGDAKLAAGIGFFLGLSLTPLAILLSFWLGALIGIVLLLFKKIARKSEIPFAPFLAAGAFLAWLLGDYILRWYFSIMWG